MEKLKLKNPNILSGGYRNFEGRQKGSSPAGVRSFAIEFDVDEAEELMRMGWELKLRNKIHPDDPDTYVLYVAVRFDKYPPNIITFTSDSARGMVMRTLNEDTVYILDKSKFEKSALVINPRIWGPNRDRVKAYLDKAIFKLETDEVDEFFADEFRQVYGDGESVSKDDDVPFDV